MESGNPNVLHWTNWNGGSLANPGKIRFFIFGLLADPQGNRVISCSISANNTNNTKKKRGTYVTRDRSSLSSLLTTLLIQSVCNSPLVLMVSAVFCTTYPCFGFPWIIWFSWPDYRYKSIASVVDAQRIYRMN
jgi:hypothetical protein